MLLSMFFYKPTILASFFINTHMNILCLEYGYIDTYLNGYIRLLPGITCTILIPAL